MVTGSKGLTASVQSTSRAMAQSAEFIKIGLILDWEEDPVHSNDYQDDDCTSCTKTWKHGNVIQASSARTRNIEHAKGHLKSAEARYDQ